MLTSFRWSCLVLTASGELCDARGARSTKDGVCEELRQRLIRAEGDRKQGVNAPPAAGPGRSGPCGPGSDGTHREVKTGPDSGRPVPHLSFSCGRKFHVWVKVQTRRKPLRVFLGVVGTEPVPSCPVPCLTHHHNRKSNTVLRQRRGITWCLSKLSSLSWFCCSQSN